MNNLKTTTELVKEVLIAQPKARNSDSYLYYCVISIIGRRNGIDIDAMSIPSFLLNMKQNNMPAFETVRRARQKIQHDHPELAACEEVEVRRMLNEKKFRDYARGIHA